MNIDNINKRAASLGGEVLWIRLVDGVTRVRVVARPGEEEPWREVQRHFLQNYVKVDDFPKAPVCLGDASCPGCRIADQIRASGDDQSANKAKAQRRFIWVAFSRDNPYDDDGNLKLKLLESPTTVFQGMARQANEWRLDFTSPDEGFDLDITRSSGSGIPKYDVRAVTTREGTTKSVVQSPLTEEELALVNEAFPDVDALTQPPEYRRFALALGFPVDEVVPTQPTPAGQTPSTLQNPAANSASNPAANPVANLASNPAANPAANLASNPAANPVANPASNPPDSAAAEPLEATVADRETVCPYFGTGFDSDDDACAGECTDASECKQRTEADPEEPVKRRPQGG